MHLHFHLVAIGQVLSVLVVVWVFVKIKDK